ncbi:MAG TPA: hypothetical protein EYP85_02840 [Armatimonadetes bacterium]|nr:hypothetical protein [Armatimonadota bacterium]
MIDVNLYCGEYPFRRLPRTTGDGLLQLMDAIGCERAVATPFAAIFYKDNLDGLRKAIEETAGVGERVFFYAVINPAFPGWERDAREALTLPGVVGWRLFPRYHHYEWLDPQVITLLQIAGEQKVPVNLTARLVDDRLDHWLLRVPPLDLDQVAGLLKQCRNTTLLLSHFYTNELNLLASAIKSHPQAYLDIGNTKPNVFWFDQVATQFDPTRLVLGTGAPLYYYQGTLLSLAKAEMDETTRHRLSHENAQRLFWEINPEGPGANNYRERNFASSS